MSVDQKNTSPEEKDEKEIDSLAKNDQDDEE